MLLRPIVAFAAAVIVAGSVVSTGGQVTADSNEAGPGVGRGAGSAISAGENHTCVLLASGAVKCWGDGSVGRLGQGTNSIGDAANEMGDFLPPVNVGVGRNAIAVTAGFIRGSVIGYAVVGVAE